MDILGALFQRRAQALLEGEDLLQVPTQTAAVRTAQPAHKTRPNKLIARHGAAVIYSNHIITL